MDDFVIYRPHKSNRGNRQKRLEEAPLANELVSLHEINEWNVRGFLFDGIIWFGDTKKYLQKVPFDTLSIGGYGETGHPAVASDIWIQSHQGRGLNVWYRLKNPAEEYQRYHKPFKWMTQMAQHVVNYLSSHQNVVLNDFRANFQTWLAYLYGPDERIQQWMSSYENEDFRPIVVSQANFLWCQASQVDNDLENHPLWGEIHPRFLSAIPENVEKGTRREMFAHSKEGEEVILRRKTTVTPYVYECFKHLPWGKFLYRQEPSVDTIKAKINHLPNHQHHHTSNVSVHDIQFTACSEPYDSDLKKSVKVGDVVAVPLDKTTSWRSNDTEWLSYVQSITNTDKGRQLGLLWLYRPSDTQCLKSPYPFSKELFLSDHCNCDDCPIYAEEVIRKPRVAFFREPAIKAVEFFVRQAYIKGDGAWRTLRESDFKCKCGGEIDEPNYLIGDTLLVSIDNILEPVVLVEQASDGIPSTVKVRRLARRNKDYGDVKAEPNELVFTDYFKIVPKAAIFRDCQVRFYTEEDKQQARIPPPYNRQGMGDFYFITSQDLGGGEPGLQPLEALPPSLMKEGWNPEVALHTPMKGLDIFCGGGNFGRGLEEGGAVQFKWAVDWNQEAIHSYKANLNPQDDVHLFHGSVNDYLTQAKQGKGGDLIAQFGEVEFIAAGSPCQGFSIANPNRGNDRSLLHVSMIASVIAFVDFYRPKYAIMENVKGIASGTDTENVLALVVSALVGLGYQVRTFALDGWNYGSPQSRSRVFISVAAPGMTPLPEPPHTHSHPENVSAASLGRLANGLPSSSRHTSQTPFSYITAAEVTNDLPATDARTFCIRYPDHRMSRNLSTLARVQIGSVPRFPGGCTFVIASKKGYMPLPQREAFDWSNGIRSRDDARGWQRVRRNALMPTVMTLPKPDDGVSGTCLHWDQERLLTILEVRRGQGFLDREVLVGLPHQQWKIVGNSVARPVALALGLSLRKAWIANNAPLENAQERELSIADVGDQEWVQSERAIMNHGLNSKPQNVWSGLEENEVVRSSPEDLSVNLRRSQQENQHKKRTIEPIQSPHNAMNGDHTSVLAASGFESPNSGGKPQANLKGQDMSVENEAAPEDGTKSLNMRTCYTEPSDLSSSRDNNCGSQRFITQEKKVSEITIRTTTTLVRKQVKPSSDL